MVRRAHHRAPAELQNDASLVENMKDMYMITKSRLDEIAEKGVSDQRGRRKTAELDTNGAKRAEARQGGVKW